MPDAAEHALIAQADAPRVDRCVSRDIQAVLEAQHESRLSLDALYAYPPSVVSRAKIHNQSCRANGGIFRAALPRLTLRMISLADFVQTKGFGLALLCSI